MHDNLFMKAYDYLNYGQVELSEEILMKLKEEDETPKLNCQIGALLIDIGSFLKKEDYIDEGIAVFEELKEETDFNVNYNLANGYSAKFILNKNNYLTKDEHLLFKAKKLYRKEIVNVSPQEFPDLYINLANTYNYIGRTIDALEYYEKVLNITINNLALVNKGIALYHYSFFSKDYVIILKEAYNCFKLALDDVGLYSDFKNISEKYMVTIEESLTEEILNQEINNNLERLSDNTLEGFMENFCLDNKLYLNLCNFCQRCKNSIGDTVVIENMLVESKYELEEDPFLILSSYLNQIKMDFVSARFLLILSQYDGIDLDFITKNVYITNTLNYEENDIRVQLLKNSFIGLFNILDKIAFFINDYLEIGKSPKKADFRSIWFNSKKTNINKKIESINNPGLNALYDIFLDLEYGNEKGYLREIRNDLTHEFLRISIIKINDNDKTIEEFTKDTIELAKIVKNAIIYLIRLVRVHEDFKRKNMDGEHIPKLNANIIQL